LAWGLILLLLSRWGRRHRRSDHAILLSQPLSLFGNFSIPLLAGFFFFIQHLLDTPLLVTDCSLTLSLLSFNHPL
jgi:hypothetical protein